MTKPGEKKSASGGAEERKARLAKALRENMHRRKAQARGRRAAAESATDSETGIETGSETGAGGAAEPDRRPG